MDNQAAIEYIRQCFASGMDEPAIRQQLAASGWPQTAIDQAFWQYNGIAPLEPEDEAAPVVQNHRPSKIRRAFIALLVLVVLVGGGLAVWVALTQSSNKTQQSATTKTAQPATKQTQKAPAKPTQKDDVLTLSSKVKEFLGKNNSIPPSTLGQPQGKTLQLCASTCDTNAVTVTFKLYEASNVQIHDYTQGLQVPNDQSIYMVPGASCLADGSGIGSQSSGSQPTMVFLYATTNGDAFTQHCVSL